MSLSTVLKIGKIYRNSTEYGLDEHRYINKTNVDIENVKKNKDEDKKAIETTIFNIPVRRNTEGVLEIFLDEKGELLEKEDTEKKLRNLNYKTSDKDKSKKYVFGDIVYSSFKKKGEMVEGGNYRMSKGKELSSFHRGKGEVAKMPLPIIGEFHKALETKLEGIEKLMISVPSIVIHFDFEGKHWFELDGVLDAVNKKLITEFIAETTLPNGRKVVALAKSLFKTIKPPLYDSETGLFKDPDGVGAATPGFRNSDSYKVRAFESADDVIDLFYAVKTAEKKMAVRIKDIGVIALPNIDFDKHQVQDFNLLAKTLNNFFPKKEEINDENYDNTEDKLGMNLKDDYDDVFQGLLENEFKDDMGFDIVFLNPPGMSTPSVDLIEISNLKKSLLRNVHARIREVKQELEKDSNIELEKLKTKPAYSIRNSFQFLLDNRKKDQKKYQSHLLKVLPQIYSDTYYNDPMLLPLFIEQVEYGIRNSGRGFNLLKYDFYFLMKIQKFDNMDSIINSKSYQLGKCLGVMSKPFAAWRDDCPIKSFEKSYVGNLSRRILSTTEAVSFANFLNEKLTIHERLYSDQREAFLEFTQTLRDFGGEKYDRNASSLGFFESYFKPEPLKPKKTDVPPSNTEG